MLTYVLNNHAIEKFTIGKTRIPNERLIASLSKISRFLKSFIEQRKPGMTNTYKNKKIYSTPFFNNNNAKSIANCIFAGYKNLSENKMSKQKILLVNPPFGRTVIREGRCQQYTLPFQTTYPPLTLANLAAILQGKYDVKIWDCIASKTNLKTFLENAKKWRSEIVFINTSTPTINADIETARLLYNSISFDKGLKLKRPKIYMFGTHVSYFKGKINEDFFEIIKGPPESFASKLMGKDYDFSESPIPAWDMVDLKRYRIPFRNKHFVLIRPSIGCPHDCSFCISPFYYGRKVKYRKVTDVILEIKSVKAIGINEFLFFSETFTVNKLYLTNLLNAIIKNNLKISFTANSRIDTIDEDILKLMKKAGCWMVSFGIESASQKILKLAGKYIDPNLIRKNILLANKAGIRTFGHFIFGLPGETKETIKKTISFSKELALDFAAFYIATPFPGSMLYEYSSRKQHFENYEYSRYRNDKKLNPELDINLKLIRIYAYISFYFKRIMNPLYTIKLIRLFLS